MAHPLAERQRIARDGEGNRIRLVTYPHTATWFTAGLLEKMGLTQNTHPAYTRAHVKYWSNVGHREYWLGGGPTPISYPRRRGYVLCTLYDPMLAECSIVNRREKSNGWEIEAWRIFASWMNEPNVHFFQPRCPVRERSQQLIDLADFCGEDVPDTDWVLVEESPDTLGVTEAYRRGEIRIEVEPAFDKLRAMPDVIDLFAARGYSLPWMS